MAWDPDRYLRFADHRSRPGLELISRIPDNEPGVIVDLGAGTGDLTAVLAERWPGARVVGIDSSPEMLERARTGHPEIEWVAADIAGWEPDDRVDLIFSNAALHWLDDHETLFTRLRSAIRPGGVIAVQMPSNWADPTHRVPAEILDDGSWPNEARDALMRDRVASPLSYAAWLEPAAIDLWSTTYYQQLTGVDPVWTWVTGSLLRPVLAVLDDADRTRLEIECKSRYAEAYPPGPDGLTVLPFTRLFMVARAR